VQSQDQDVTRANRYFVGKLDILPFVEKVPAQRGSRNRPRGTLELKPCLPPGKFSRSSS
jgi:hypothetical protein